MEKLLQWAVNNSNPEELKKQAEAVRRGEIKPDPSKFNPEVIEAILGKDDATRMKEAVDCLIDPEDTVDNKEIALDNLELLIEGIDNAKNIENMKLWPKILGQLNAPEPEIRKGVAWVCGTAVQNNPDAQAAFLANNGMEPLLKLLKEEKDKAVKAKAIYAVSGILKHCTSAIQLFLAEGGLEVLCSTVKNSDDVAAVRKVIFMFNSLMIDSPDIAPALLKNDILESLDGVLVKYSKDEDACEKALRTLHTLKTQTNCPLSSGLKKHCEDAGNAFGIDNLNLSKDEWKELLA